MRHQYSLGVQPNYKLPKRWGTPVSRETILLLIWDQETRQRKINAFIAPNKMGNFFPHCYICSWFDSQDEPRPLSLIDFRCQRQANNGGSIGIYQEVLQGCSWAFLLQVFSSLSSLSFFFSFPSSSPFLYKRAPDPQGEHYCSKVEGPYLFSPLPGFRVRLDALSHNLAQFDQYIGAVLCHSRTKARPWVLSKDFVRHGAACSLYKGINENVDFILCDLCLVFF